MKIMTKERKSIPEDRPLTAEETALVRWLLEHGFAEADAFVPQLEQARVVSRCPCGCASINFSIEGKLPPIGDPLQVLSDYEWESESGAKLGVFVFAKAGILAGLEIWSIDGLGTPTLPRIESLVPIRWAKD